MRPKKIPQTNIPGAVKMSAMELNKERFQPKQTVLTPELVEELMRGKQTTYCGMSMRSYRRYR